MEIIVFYLGLITSLVIVLSKMCNVNPDNVATPIAGALGDITALVILSFTATLFYNILSVLLNIKFFLNNYVFSLQRALRGCTL
jgi:solute carrier family 41